MDSFRVSLQHPTVWRDVMLGRLPPGAIGPMLQHLPTWWMLTPSLALSELVAVAGDDSDAGKASGKAAEHLQLRRGSAGKSIP